MAAEVGPRSPIDNQSMPWGKELRGGLARAAVLGLLLLGGCARAETVVAHPSAERLAKINEAAVGAALTTLDTMHLRMTNGESRMDKEDYTDMPTHDIPALFQWLGKMTKGEAAAYVKNTHELCRPYAAEQERIVATKCKVWSDESTVAFDGLTTNVHDKGDGTAELSIGAYGGKIDVRKDLEERIMWMTRKKTSAVSEYALDMVLTTRAMPHERNLTIEAVRAMLTSGEARLVNTAVTTYDDDGQFKKKYEYIVGANGEVTAVKRSFKPDNSPSSGKTPAEGLESVIEEYNKMLIRA